MKEELAEIIRTFEAVGPLVGNAVKSGQLFNPQAELTEPDPDILCEYDVEIPMSEGFSLTANIFQVSFWGKCSWLGMNSRTKHGQFCGSKA